MEQNLPPSVKCCFAGCTEMTSLNQIHYSYNNRKNSHTKMILKGTCRRLHTFHVCPVCYKSYGAISGSKRCFTSHPREIRCQLFTGCSGCNTYDELMEKHCPQFPFFSELLSSAHLNYKQKQMDISTLLSESNNMPFTQSDVELLRASSNIDTSGVSVDFGGQSLGNGDDIYQYMTYFEQSNTEPEVVLNSQQILPKPISDRRKFLSIKCQQAIMDSSWTYFTSKPTYPSIGNPLVPRNSCYPFGSYKRLLFTINHKIRSNISDSNLDPLLKDLHNVYLEKGNSVESYLFLETYLS